MAPVALSVAEACEAANLSHTTLYKAMNSGALRAVKNHKRTLILAEDLKQWLASLPAYTPARAA
jgi:excisionase family DNA binding protein